ncbi:glycerate kinase [Rossellomorea aquimaris]|uniref:glycerate kinase family protein n=1 Tax=Rossellomorea aquimaris TaxID=189382 RepID=UPI001CD312AA|nr:glycerate kinase [Rossellomorea aquimaris]MCA1057311.1 glycerate kinase [Rossellomorea aquimaris]
MKIIIAPDSFKGSMTSLEASKAIQRGIERAVTSPQLSVIPMADGGEGTVESIVSILGGEILERNVLDPLGRDISAVFGWIPETKTAVIETAAASGLPLLKDHELNPDESSTYGTGQQVQYALELGAERIILGLGGSATVDGGTGFLRALGVRFFDEAGLELAGGGNVLGAIHTIDSSGIEHRLRQMEWVVASDVTNPLLGEEGAIRVFGPQKGVTEAQLAVFEKRMEHFAQIVEKHTGKGRRASEGSGAAGGFGFALHSFFNPSFQSGFSLIAQLSGLHDEMKGASLVLTGEGKVDAQSLYGKVPVGVGRIAREHHIPVVAFTGKSEGSIEKLSSEGVSLVFPIVDSPMTLNEAMKNASTLLEKAAERLMRAFLLDK